MEHQPLLKPETTRREKDSFTVSSVIYQELLTGAPNWEGGLALCPQKLIRTDSTIDLSQKTEKTSLNSCDMVVKLFETYIQEDILCSVICMMQALDFLRDTPDDFLYRAFCMTPFCPSFK